MQSLVRGALGALVDLVLPANCVHCGRAGGVVCAGCTADLRPVRVVAGDVSVFAAAEYDAAVRSAVLAYKERDRRDVAGWLADRLETAIGAAVAHGPVRPIVVPIPTSRAARAARGGDHLRRLAGPAARALRLRLAPASTLRLRRVPLDSAGLGAGDRAANMAGAMVAAPAPDGATALVVDDVVTTGATIGEAVRALHAAGWRVLAGAVVAATPRRVQHVRDGIGSPPGTD